MLEKCQIGELLITTPDGLSFKIDGKIIGPQATFRINDWSVIDSLLKSGDIGLGESYTDFSWDSDDLAEFISYGTLNLKYIEKYAYGSLWRRFIYRLYNNWLRANSKRGSKSNIKAHYDIGNEFYQLWLDSTMTYSSALRTTSSSSLEEAQSNKYQRILDLLGEKKANILEIGCGWGGFAETASKIGHKLTGITISKEQFNFARKRLQEKANIVFQDYRNIQEKYDAIVSIEMFEAVGEKYWETYFKTLKNCLNKNGKAIIQTITIEDSIFDNYRKDTDYIRQYVFPGGMLPSKSRFIEEANKVGLKVESVLEFGKDYSWTLRQWLDRITAVEGRIKEIGYNESFLRAWKFYLQMCISGFETERTNVMQIELST
ncbi:MAG: class I SAM-dependent methyltransferase [Proteobacteria bacterium]|nr:class I SAM-dependent methyltransferase [Pseudomonadota bacterium]